MYIQVEFVPPELDRVCRPYAPLVRLALVLAGCSLNLLESGFQFVGVFPLAIPEGGLIPVRLSQEGRLYCGDSPPV